MCLVLLALLIILDNEEIKCKLISCDINLFYSVLIEIFLY